MELKCDNCQHEMEIDDHNFHPTMNCHECGIRFGDVDTATPEPPVVGVNPDKYLLFSGLDTNITSRPSELMSSRNVCSLLTMLTNYHLDYQFY